MLKTKLKELVKNKKNQNVISFEILDDKKSKELTGGCRVLTTCANHSGNCDMLMNCSSYRSKDDLTFQMQ